LVADARNVRADLQHADVLQQKQQLQQQSEELRQKISGAQADEVASLRKQLDERQSSAAHRNGIADCRGRDSCLCAERLLLHVSVSFVERASGRPLRYGGINPDGGPLKDSDGNPVYTLEGRAPEVRADFFGTGFIVGEGRILTNHHVVQPWWKNDELASVLSQVSLQRLRK